MTKSEVEYTTSLAKDLTSLNKSSSTDKKSDKNATKEHDKKDFKPVPKFIKSRAKDLTSPEKSQTEP